MYDSITITIPNWHEHNKGLKKGHTYFRISKRFFDDEKIIRLTNSERLAYLYVLSVCAGELRETVTLITSQLRLSARLKPGAVLGAFRRLESFQLLSIVKHSPNRIEKKRKEEKRTEMPDRIDAGDSVLPVVQQTLIDDPPQTKFDFETVYTNYPRKEGKSRGFTLLKRQIKSPDDYEKLSIAVNNYRKRCEEKRVEPKYIKHFATFVNEWRDWVDENHGATESFATPTGRRSWA